MNYHPVIAENQTNSHAGLQDTEKAGEEGTHTYVLFPVLSDGSTNSQNNNKDALVDGKEHDDDIQKSVSSDIHSSSSGAQTRKQEYTNNSSNRVNAASSLVSIAGHNFINSTNDFSVAGPSNDAASPTAVNSSDMPNLEDLTHSDNTDDVGAEADINNLESIISTRSMARTVRDQGGISQMFNEDFHTCMFSYFLSQEEPKRVHRTLKDPSWIKAMQEELLQNKKDERGIVIRNKARLVAQGHTKEEGIDYDEALYGLHQAPRACAVKRIFRYLKGKPYLGLWYPKDSPFDLVAYSDSDYAVVATSLTEAEYVAAASGCAQ
nr:hypothetical protein [Tanacetum cinerariifolium]